MQYCYLYGLIILKTIFLLFVDNMNNSSKLKSKNDFQIRNKLTNMIRSSWKSAYIVRGGSRGGARGARPPLRFNNYPKGLQFESTSYKVNVYLLPTYS